MSSYGIMQWKGAPLLGSNQDPSDIWKSEIKFAILIHGEQNPPQIQLNLNFNTTILFSFRHAQCSLPLQLHLENKSSPGAHMYYMII